MSGAFGSAPRAAHVGYASPNSMYLYLFRTYGSFRAAEQADCLAHRGGGARRHGGHRSWCTHGGVRISPGCWRFVSIYTDPALSLPADPEVRP